MDFISSGQPVLQGPIVQATAYSLPAIIGSYFGHLMYASADESLNAFHNQIARTIEVLLSQRPFPFAFSL
jgi:hypothetical protein